VVEPVWSGDGAGERNDALTAITMLSYNCSTSASFVNKPTAPAFMMASRNSLVAWNDKPTTIVSGYSCLMANTSESKVVVNQCTDLTVTLCASQHGAIWTSSP